MPHRTSRPRRLSADKLVDGSDDDGEGKEGTDASEEGGEPDPHPRKRLWWIIGAAAAVAVIVIGLILLLKPAHKTTDLQLPENDACDADSCGSTPIRFFLDSNSQPDQITVTLTDPSDNDVSRRRSTLGASRRPRSPVDVVRASTTTRSAITP